MASKVVASAPIFFLSKLLRHRVHRQSGLTRPFAAPTRTFSTRPPPPPHGFSHHDGLDANPFMRKGEVGPCRVDKTKNEGYIMRVDVPGIGKDDMRLWVESGLIYFCAKDSKIPDYNYDGRVFGGSISFNPARFDSDQIRSEVRNGVLWIFVPRLNK